jgi:Methyltransferase domain
MRAVICSGTHLPFQDRSFEVVLVSDVLEHVPPDQRRDLIAEAFRVARKAAVFGYPCGPDAFSLDKRLRSDYLSRNLSAPDWLEEHMRYPFPDEDLFMNLPKGWTGIAIPNESLKFHYWMMRKEMQRPFDALFRLGLKLMPRIVELLLRRVDVEPCYRKIFVLTRSEQVP